MSRKWSVALVAITFLSVGALIGTVIAPRSVDAAKEPEKATSPRMAFVNLAKVLREYQKANNDGKKINEKRQEYINKVKPLRDSLAAKSQLIQQTSDTREKALLQMEANALQRETADLEAEGQRALGELSERVIVEVYAQIRAAISSIAKERGLDVVECYPDSSTPEDEKKAAVAQLKLQTPALIPFYLNKDYDLTEEVIKTLNKK